MYAVPEIIPAGVDREQRRQPQQHDPDQGGRGQNLLACLAGDQVVPVVTQIGLLLLWASAILTMYTGYDYFRAGIHHLIKEDEG